MLLNKPARPLTKLSGLVDKPVLLESVRPLNRINLVDNKGLLDGLIPHPAAPYGVMRPSAGGAIAPSVDDNPLSMLSTCFSFCNTG